MPSASTLRTVSSYRREYLPKKDALLPIKLFPPLQLPQISPENLPPKLSFNLETDSTEKRVLLIIPTKNPSKTELLLAHFKENLPPNTELHHLAFAGASSGVGEQPYDQSGIIGAHNRIDHIVTCLPLIPDVVAEVVSHRITTIIVAAIESFIARPGYRPPPPGQEPSTEPIDYASIMFYNPVTRVVTTGVSTGASVPKEYYEEAQKYGFSDPYDDFMFAHLRKEKTLSKEALVRHGRVMVGEILAANIEGLDKADWHKFLTDGRVSRDYELAYLDDHPSTRRYHGPDPGTSWREDASNAAQGLKAVENEFHVLQALGGESSWRGGLKLIVLAAIGTPRLATIKLDGSKMKIPTEDKAQPWKGLFPLVYSGNGAAKAPWKVWKPQPDAPDQKPWYQWMNDADLNPNLGKKPTGLSDEERGRGMHHPTRKRSGSAAGTVAEGG
ncbi:hypothetical protein B0T21DRAFT_406852 [Apiosordaria backusii]|uniref:Uncharacterized protein n=1 Tax=Apiosordaria backusii TaxID=314023 RepID=A0AA40EZB7_9PEZI|nr:hypothetical protein B0T21DRAFT_406852 [Apiosordaria backusii]